MKVRRSEQMLQSSGSWIPRLDADLQDYIRTKTQAKLPSQRYRCRKIPSSGIVQ